MMIVPMGGSAFIVGWIALAISALRGSPDAHEIHELQSDSASGPSEEPQIVDST